MPAPVIFISYSHDSEAHRDEVLALAERLRKDGLDARIDRYENGTPAPGWPRWMLDQLDAADFVLVVCTEARRWTAVCGCGPAAPNGGDRTASRCGRAAPYVWLYPSTR